MKNFCFWDGFFEKENNPFSKKKLLLNKAEFRSKDNMKWVKKNKKLSHN